MDIRTLSIGAAVTLVFACGGLGWYAWELRQQLLETQALQADLQSKADNLQTQAARLDSDLDAARRSAEALEREKERLLREKENAARAVQSLEKDMRDALESRNVTISELQGKLTVNILDRVLFSSGQAELTEEGKQVLQEIGRVLATAPDRQILVVGHTDNVPIQSMKYLYDSNWELSTARANAAVRYLSESAGVDPRRLGAVGFGQYRPIADNSTPEGRAQNRRIAIVIPTQDFLASEKPPVPAKPLPPSEK
jgi:chemotaxis protein MotB